MKKILSFVVVVVMIAMLFCLTSCERFSHVSISTRYELNEDGQSYTLVNLGLNSNQEKVITIPETYNGLPVTVIGEHAFLLSCWDTEYVYIPETIMEIHCKIYYDSFNCNEYKNGYYLGSENNPYHALMCIKDTSISSFEIHPDTKVIAYGVFSGCKSLKSIELHNSLKSIGAYAFSGCENLTSITLPDSLEIIGEGAFSSCDSLISIEIPNKVKVIPDNVFKFCSSLESISLGDSVMSIGQAALPEVKRIEVSANNQYYKSIDGNFYTAEGVLLRYLSVKDEEHIVLPDYVTGIGAAVFAGFDNLISIEIPNSVTSIGNYAFAGCTNLKNIEIPNSVKSIGERAFYECTGLKSIDIPSSVVSMGESVFKDGAELIIYCESKSRPQGWNEFWATRISVLWGETEGLEYRLNEDGESYSVSGIGTCDHLDIWIPDTYNGLPVTGIYEKAFYGCTFATIRIPDSVTYIGDRAFENCELFYVDIPNSVVSIGDYAFVNCIFLEKVSIPSSVLSIGECAFTECYRCSIYCEAKTKPEGWNELWCEYIINVIWGYTGE